MLDTHLTAFTRASSQPLPPKLELLSAPVVEARAEAMGDVVGVVEGVLVGEGGRVQSFIVRLGAGHRASELVLVPLAAVEIGTTGSSLDTRWRPIVRLLWTRDQLLSQPVFSADGGQPLGDLDGLHARERGSLLPGRAHGVPPGVGVNRPMALRNAAGGGLLAGLAGAAVGLVTTGPVGALALGAFFAFGGGIAGAIAGGSRESAADAELGPTRRATTAGTWQVRALEQELRRAGTPAGVLRARVVTSSMLHDRGAARRGPAPREASSRG